MNHDLFESEDNLRLIEELEHLRKHSLRAARVAHLEEDKERELFWLVTAQRCKTQRRIVQARHEGVIESEWCPLKSAQSIRQLNYETMSGDIETFNALEELVDSVNSHILKQDMTGCKSCQEDATLSKM